MPSFPELESLTRRLSECPADFLAEPRIGVAGTVVVSAVVADVMHTLGGALTEKQAQAFQSKNAKKDRNYLQLILITCWLLADPALKPLAEVATIYTLLTTEVRELAELTTAPRFIADPDRREELVRMCLKRLGARPAGESEAQAQDRLATLNTAERQRVVAAARAAEERAQQIREALAKKEAEEAADKWGRE